MRLIPRVFVDRDSSTTCPTKRWGFFLRNRAGSPAFAELDKNGPRCSIVTMEHGEAPPSPAGLFVAAPAVRIAQPLRHSLLSMSRLVLLVAALAVLAGCDKPAPAWVQASCALMVQRHQYPDQRSCIEAAHAAGAF